MAKLKRSTKEPKGELAWRRKQKPGAIMKPSTFKKIEKESGSGEKGKRIAGAAYWDTVEAKYSGRKKVSKKKARM